MIKKYLDMALRKQRIIIFMVLIGIGAGLGQYARMPKVYNATALLKYQRQRVNPARMSPDDVRSRTQEVVGTVRQQVTSRTSLEGLITQFNLYKKLRERAPMEDVVTHMREKDIIIKPAGRRGDVYEIAFQGGEPRTVMLVTNALAAKFIEENLRFRAEQASETSSYIQDELAMAKKSLDKKEAGMRDYKLKWYNEMPGQQQANISRLNALQTQSQGMQTSIHDLQRTKVMVQEQISVRKDTLSQLIRDDLPQPQPGNGQQAVSAPAQRLQQLRNLLHDLESRYTANYPEVRRVKRQVEELEKELSPTAGKTEEVPEGEPSVGRTSADKLAFVLKTDTQLQQLHQQLSQLTYEIGELQQENKLVQAEIKKYQQWVAATPKREAEWAALTRDYQQLSQHYQELVTLSLNAESAYSLEKQQKGSQFKIVDPAHLPEKPVSPVFLQIMLLAGAGGLGMGLALGLGLELLNTSFKDPFDLEKSLGLPVICAIPHMPSKSEVMRKRVLAIIWWFCCLLGVVAIIGGVYYMWQKGILII